MLGAGGHVWSTRVAFRQGDPYLPCTSPLLVHSPSNMASTDGVYIAQRPLAWMQQCRQPQSRFRPLAEPAAAPVQAVEGEGASRLRAGSALCASEASGHEGEAAGGGATRLRPGGTKCASAWSSEAAEQTTEGEEANQPRPGCGKSNPMSISIGHAGSISGAGSGMQRVLGRFTVNPQPTPPQQQQPQQKQALIARKPCMNRTPQPREEQQRPVEAAAAQPIAAAAAALQHTAPQDSVGAPRNRAARPSRILDSPVSSISLDSADDSEVPPAPRTDACGRTRGARRQQPQTADTSAAPAGDALAMLPTGNWPPQWRGRLAGELPVPDAHQSATASMPLLRENTLAPVRCW